MQVFKKPDFWSGLFFLLLGVVICCSSASMGLGKLSKPGPGFLPFLSGLVIVFLSTVLLVRVYRVSDWESWVVQIGRVKIATVLISMLAYGFLLERTGFLLTTFLFVAYSLRAIEPQSWKKVILGGLLTAIASYLLFEIFLKVQLPKSFIRIF